MVAKPKITEDFAADADVQVAPEDWEWETVAEGAPTGIVFETIGETFVGQYIEIRSVDREPAADGSDQSFKMYVFKGRDGDLYSLPMSYALEEAMRKVSPADWVRITYLKDIKTARNLNPMKDFKVDIRR